MTHSTLRTRVEENINNWLPSFCNCLEKYIEFCPLTESDTIVLDPSACELCDGVDITENL